MRLSRKCGNPTIHWIVVDGAENPILAECRCHLLLCDFGADRAIGPVEPLDSFLLRRGASGKDSTRRSAPFQLRRPHYVRGDPMRQGIVHNLSHPYTPKNPFLCTISDASRRECCQRRTNERRQTHQTDSWNPPVRARMKWFSADLLFHGAQPSNCRAVDNFPGWFEARSMTRTIPRSFCRIPPDNTTQVRAYGGALV